jgi:hypothetical protein
MTEPVVAPVQEPPAVPATPAPAAATPPWGADFDADKAWQLVQHLRADKEKLAARPVLTPEHQQQLADHQRLLEMGKSELQRHQEAAAAAQAAAEKATADAIRWKAAATHSIPAEDFDLLGTGTEEEITSRAQRIAAKNAAQAAAAAPTPPTPVIPSPVTRPVAQMLPGATPTDAPNEDDQILAALGLGPKQ